MQNLSYMLFKYFFYRSHSKNNRSPLPLLYGAVERVRLLAGPGFNFGNLDGGHHDRPANFAHATARRPSVSHRENLKTD